MYLSVRVYPQSQMMRRRWVCLFVIFLLFAEVSAGSHRRRRERARVFHQSVRAHNAMVKFAEGNEAEIDVESVADVIEAEKGEESDEPRKLAMTGGFGM